MCHEAPLKSELSGESPGGLWGGDIHNAPFPDTSGSVTKAFFRNHSASRPASRPTDVVVAVSTFALIVRSPRLGLSPCWRIPNESPRVTADPIFHTIRYAGRLRKRGVNPTMKLACLAGL